MAKHEQSMILGSACVFHTFSRIYEITGVSQGLKMLMVKCQLEQVGLWYVFK